MQYAETNDECIRYITEKDGRLFCYISSIFKNAIEKMTF